MKVEPNKWGSVILVAEDLEERAFLVCASKPNFKLELRLSTTGERLLLSLKKQMDDGYNERRVTRGVQMKKNVDITYDGLTSTYGVEPTSTAILTVIKNPEAGTLRVMVNEVDAVDREALLQDWKENWEQIGRRVRQELTRIE